MWRMVWCGWATRQWPCRCAGGVEVEECEVGRRVLQPHLLSAVLQSPNVGSAIVGGSQYLLLLEGSSEVRSTLLTVCVRACVSLTW